MALLWANVLHFSWEMVEVACVSIERQIWFEGSFVDCQGISMWPLIQIPVGNQLNWIPMVSIWNRSYFNWEFTELGVFIWIFQLRFLTGFSNRILKPPVVLFSERRNISFWCVFQLNEIFPVHVGLFPLEIDLVRKVQNFKSSQSEVEMDLELYYSMSDLSIICDPNI